ncbi:MAG: fluoride efflux transporter CrcB [Planctomycetota bacterium]
MASPAVWIGVACGGAVGATVRWLVATAVDGRSGTSFPIGTLCVNAVGCLAIGYLSVAAADWPEPRRAAVLTGMLGALTTFSTFGLEAHLLHAEHGRTDWAMLHVAAHVGCGLLLVWAGRALAG